MNEENEATPGRGVRAAHPKPCNLRALARAMHKEGAERSGEKLESAAKASVRWAQEGIGELMCEWFAEKCGMRDWAALDEWRTKHETLWFGAGPMPARVTPTHVFAGAKAPAGSAEEARDMIAEHLTDAAERIEYWRIEQMPEAEEVRLAPEGERPVRFTGVRLARSASAGEAIEVYETVGGWIVIARRAPENGAIARIRQAWRPARPRHNERVCEDYEEHVRRTLADAGVLAKVHLEGADASAEDAIERMCTTDDEGCAAIAPVVMNARLRAEHTDRIRSGGEGRERTIDTTLYELRSGRLALVSEARGEGGVATIGVHNDAEALLEAHPRWNGAIALCEAAHIDTTRTIE